jgi:hypothetical protein
MAERDRHAEGPDVQRARFGRVPRATTGTGERLNCFSKCVVMC